MHKTPVEVCPLCEHFAELDRLHELIGKFEGDIEGRGKVIDLLTRTVDEARALAKRFWPSYKAACGADERSDLDVETLAAAPWLEDER